MAPRLRILLRAAARDLPLARTARRELQRFALALSLEGRELSVWLCGDASIRRLNRIHRSLDRATDVLSFPTPANPAGWPVRPLGDLVVSLQTARREARARQRPIREELALYLAHGLLHLLGHDHELPGEARRMAALERRLLGAAGLIGQAAAKPPEHQSSDRKRVSRESSLGAGRESISR